MLRCRAEASNVASADALLIATPPYAVPTGREIALHCLAVERAVPLPAMLYNYPGRMGVKLDEACLDPSKLLTRAGMRVAQLPCDPGTTGWNAILPPEPLRPAPESMDPADWLVIGAGFAGLAAARRLRQLRPDDRIAILEASRVAHGPAGRNSGSMIDLPHVLQSEDYGGAAEDDRRQTAQNRAAIEFPAAAEYGLGDEAFARAGKINAAATEKGLRRNASYARHLTALGEPHNLIDAKEMGRTRRHHLLSRRPVHARNGDDPACALHPRARPRPRLQPHGAMGELAGRRAGDGGTRMVRTNSRRIGHRLSRHPRRQRSRRELRLLPRRLLHVFLYAPMTRALTDDEVAGLGGRPR